MKSSLRLPTCLLLISAVAWQALRVDAGTKKKGYSNGSYGEPECEDGHNWKEDCNDCVCENGRVTCTALACGDEQVTSCKDDSTWKEECNTCICLDGEPACTLMTCNGDKVTSCKDGSSWKEDCNTCICIDGEPACTLMTCNGDKEECPDVADTCPQDCVVEYYITDTFCTACRCKQDDKSNESSDGKYKSHGYSKKTSESIESSDGKYKSHGYSKKTTDSIESTECSDIPVSELCPPDCPTKFYTDKNGCKACRCRKKGYARR